MFERLAIARHFIHTRTRLDFRSREALLAWQQQKLQTFLSQRLPHATFYKDYIGQPLEALPIVDKATVMANFAGMNSRRIGLEEAMALALQAEESRNFTPTLHGVSIGLSSGTSGNRGLFMATAAERRLWAGILLARALPSALFKQLLRPWKPAVKIAFFLRANSNVYTTLGSGRINFVFYDLLAGLEAALPALQQQAPDVLVAPANVLKCLAEWVAQGRLILKPRHIISVAEVLEPDDEQRVQAVFQQKIFQIYQATEGFLGYSCELGGLHLNEACVHVEPEWLDEEKTRFQPILTDFTRSTQMIVRYRLNDVLRVAPQPCACGRAELTLAAIEGRCDDVLWLPSVSGDKVAIFPDYLRRAMLLAGDGIEDYRLQLHGMTLFVEVKSHDLPAIYPRIEHELARVWLQFGVIAPDLNWRDWSEQTATQKRRRIRGDDGATLLEDPSCPAF